MPPTAAITPAAAVATPADAVVAPAAAVVPPAAVVTPAAAVVVPAAAVVVPAAARRKESKRKESGSAVVAPYQAGEAVQVEIEWAGEVTWYDATVQSCRKKQRFEGWAAVVEVDCRGWGSEVDSSAYVEVYDLPTDSGDIRARSTVIDEARIQ